MSTTLEAAVLAPFAIEAATQRNDDLVIQCIPGCRLRGRVNSQNGVYVEATDSFEVPRDQAIGMSGLPVIPGMVLTLDPDSGEYSITDPLHDNVDLCERITSWLNRNSPFRSKTTVKGVKPVEGKLDIHSRKTLAREMFNIAAAKEGIVVKGAMPTMRQIEKLPGEFLLNPGSRVQNTQPRFEKDWDTWLDKVNRLGD